MAEDVDAAVRGALAAGATRITVNDAHGPMRNLLPENLHRAARLIRGRPKQMGMLDGLGPEYDAVLCVGYHSRAGTLGVLSHSFMGHEIEDMWLDGAPVGEIGLAHATAAAVGVPVAALTGDDAACAEMTQWDASVSTVAVKYAQVRARPFRRRPACARRGARRDRAGGRGEPSGPAGQARAVPFGRGHPHRPMAVRLGGRHAPGHPGRHLPGLPDGAGPRRASGALPPFRRVDAGGGFPDQPAAVLLSSERPGSKKPLPDGGNRQGPFWGAGGRIRLRSRHVWVNAKRFRAVPSNRAPVL